MLDLVVVDGRARGIVTRDLVTGEVSSHAGDAVVLATGGYGNVFYLSTNAKGCNATAIWRAHKRGALFANPCFTQIHPTCIPVTRRLPVEAHADVRVAAQRRPHLGARSSRATTAPPDQIPEARARLLPGAQVPELRQPRARATSPRAPPRRSATRAAASARAGAASTSTSRDAIGRLGERRRSGSATATCSRCTSGSPTRTPTRCRCGSTRPSTTRWAGSGSTTT